MTSDEQMAEWVSGNPLHNDTLDECCPDFSCCKPELLASLECRKAFVVADKETRMSFLGTFLGAAMSSMGEKAHVVGADDPEKQCGPLS